MKSKRRGYFEIDNKSHSGSSSITSSSVHLLTIRRLLEALLSEQAIPPLLPSLFCMQSLRPFFPLWFCAFLCASSHFFVFDQFTLDFFKKSVYALKPFFCQNEFFPSQQFFFTPLSTYLFNLWFFSIKNLNCE